MSQNGPRTAHDRITVPNNNMKQSRTKSNNADIKEHPSNSIKQPTNNRALRGISGHGTLRAWQSGATFNVGKVWTRNPHLKDLQCNVGCVLPMVQTGQTPRQLHFLSWLALLPLLSLILIYNATGRAVKVAASQAQSSHSVSWSQVHYW